MPGNLQPDLAETARAIADGTRKAIGWVTDPASAEIVEERRGVVERDLRRCLGAANRLVEAASRPMAVAVFGPSQVGKSHLISVLARKGSALKVLFAGQREPVDYIRQINPDKGKEATGLVSRFTLRERPTPDGFPVALRLLAPADVIKMLANTYFFDGNPARYETWPTTDEIGRHIEELEQTARDGGAGGYGLSSDDVWDIAEYLDIYLAESELTKRLHSQWDRIAALAGNLSIARAAELWSVLWGRHDQLTQLFRTLLEAHAKLGFATEVFCQLAAVDATDHSALSILDVDCLLYLGQADAPEIAVRRADREPVKLPRAVVAALTAEVRFVLAEKPWDFLDHTDLLDFPGYRGRGLGATPEDEQLDGKALKGLAYHLKRNTAKTLEEMLLRGKVEYLFQRYMADQDITAMLLCIKESNMDVKKLSDVVAQWVSSSHGARPQDRVGKKTLLFFIFTRFDVHFERKPSDETLGLEQRFEGRMKASLIDPFGKSPESWVQKWTPTAPFANCYLMRNPTIKNTAVFTLRGDTEDAIAPDQEEHVKDLRRAFSSVDLVRRHFPEPERAFDEMMRLNDGGATYIATHLAPVCGPEVKPAQIHDRIKELRRRIRSAVEPFYVPTDVKARVDARIQAANTTLDQLEPPIEHKRFGLFLSGLMLDPADLSDRLYESLIRRPDKPEGQSPAPSAVAVKPPAAPRIPRPGRKESRPAAQAAAPAADSAFNASETLEARSTPEFLARLAMRIWLDHLYRRSNDPLFARDVLMESAAIREIVGEIAKAASRMRLADRILNEINALKFIDKLDERLAKAAIIIEHRLNQFVTDLGFSAVPVDQRPVVDWTTHKTPIFEPRPVTWDISGLKAEQREFRRVFIADWQYGLYQLFIDNAESDAGLDKNKKQNEMLGEILAEIGNGE